MFGDLLSLTQPEAALAAAGIGFVGQQLTNSAQADAAQAQTDFQERMSNSAYQRQVKDLEAAGLNPMLAYIKGGGASTPTGSMPVYSNPASVGVQAYQSAAQANKTVAEIPLVESMVDRTVQEVKNLKTDNEKAKVVIDNLLKEGQNLFKTNLNLTEVGNQLRKSIELMEAQIVNFGAITSSTQWQAKINELETQLKQMDVSASEGVGNIGRQSAQFKTLIDLLKVAMRK